MLPESFHKPVIDRLLNEYPRFARAYAIAQHYHKDQKWGKHEYMYHIDNVIINVYEEVHEVYMDYSINSFLAVAALHDVYEDYRDILTLNQLHDLMMIGEENSKVVDLIIESVDCISKKPKGEERYSDYVQRVMSKLYSRLVKKGDLKHNMSDQTSGSRFDKYDLTLFLLEKQN